MGEATLERLIHQVKDDMQQAGFGQLEGLSPGELQKFLEDKVGMPEDGEQGTIISIIVVATLVFSCLGCDDVEVDGG